MVSKDDLKILYFLHKNECTSEIKSFTIQKIHEVTQFKNGKIRYSINALLMANYIGEGYRSGNAGSFFITQKGIELLKGVSD